MRLRLYFVKENSSTTSTDAVLTHQSIIFIDSRSKHEEVSYKIVVPKKKAQPLKNVSESIYF